MKLLADSGSTKTAWLLVTENTIHQFSTKGMNPYFISPEEIYSEIQANFPDNVEKSAINEIHFFGSGCGRNDSKQKIYDSLQTIFAKAQIFVESDLVGAAIASYGKSSGIIAILGTGMNIGFWNGTELFTPLPSLGYVLGDSGSGAVLGRNLIKAIFERSLPAELCQKFHQTYKISLAELLDKVYKQPQPNAFLASFVPFLAENKSLPEVSEIICQSFREFAKNYAFPISKEFSETKISFVGSLSLIFNEELKTELHKFGLQLQKTIANPITEIGKYFQNITN